VSLSNTSKFFKDLLYRNIVMSSKVLHMRLSPKDLRKIELLKVKYRIDKTPELIRHVITNEFEKFLEEYKSRERSTMYSSQSQTSPDNPKV
jgi:hypothetical protein